MFQKIQMNWSADLATGGGAAETTNAAEVAAEAPEGYVGTDGSFVSGWTERLPEDLAEAKPTLSKYKNFPEMAKALHHANQLLGRRGVTVPTAQSTPEEVAAYRKMIGAPESLEGYAMRPEHLPEGMSWQDDLAKPFAQWAHKHHLPQAAMSELVDLHLAQRQGEFSQIAQMAEQRREEGLRTLRETWGGHFQKNIDLAGRAAKLAGVNSLSDGFGDPEVVKGFVKLATMLSDDRFIGGAGGLGMRPPAEEAKEIQTNPDHPLYRKYQEGDPEAVDYVRSLFKKAAGN